MFSGIEKEEKFCSRARWFFARIFSSFFFLFQYRSFLIRIDVCGFGEFGMNFSIVRIPKQLSISYLAQKHPRPK